MMDYPLFVAIQQIYEPADQMTHDGGLILRPRFEEDCSNREIAERSGASHKAVNILMSIMLAHFHKNKRLMRERPIKRLLIGC